ncbi:MAG: branched-chain amino acid ABC transporter permease, partial [Acidimicrobiales bacterium]
PITAPAKRPLVYAAAAVVAAVLIVPDLSARWDLAVVTSLTTMILMLSLVLLVGYLGQVSLVNLSLAGVAAYATVRFASDGTRESDFLPVVVDGLGLPDPIAFVLGVGAAVAVGLLVGIPALRIRGVHLAVVTLAAALTIEQLIFANETIVGPGARSNTPVPRPEWFGVDLGPQDTTTNLFDRWQFTFFVVLMTVLVALAVANLRRGQTGRRFLATRGNERAAEAAGLDVARTKMLGFGISSAIAGIAGVLVAYQRTVLQVTSFDELGGLGSLAFVYLGGITSVAGAFLGSLLVAGGILPTFLRGGGGGSPSFISSAIAGILLVVVAIAYPDGLAAAMNRGARRVGRAVLKPVRSLSRSRSG